MSKKLAIFGSISITLFLTVALAQTGGATPPSKTPGIIAGINYIVTAVASSFIGGLSVYFFSTKNMEARMKDVVKEHLGIHNEIEHKENPYDISDRRIKEHKEECGDKMDKAFKELSNTVRKLEIHQTKTQIIMTGMNATLTQIAKKMNVAEMPPNINGA